jgi:hypothetical protein
MEVNMSEEITIYEHENIKVTNLRAVFGETTYAISNITAVKKNEVPAPIGCATLAVAGGALVLLYQVGQFFQNSKYSATAGGFSGTWFLLALILLGLGIYTIRTEKPSYNVHISTASGEIKAFTSKDKGQIETIVNALNDAIIKKG